MTDTYMLMRALCETKERRASKWRPPSETQLNLEKSLTRAIKTFIDSAKLAQHGVTMPDETAHDRLLDTVTSCLERAVHEGRRIATGRHERGIISAARNIAGRAVQLVSDIVDSLQEKARDIIETLFGSDESEATIEDAESELEEWAAGYAEGVAENEIQMAVQETIVEEMQNQGVTLFDLVLDPDACEKCRAIYAKTPTISSKGRFPPFHMRCRCGVEEHEE